MKAVQKITSEIIIEGNAIEIQGVKIGGKERQLTITNWANISRLDFDFDDGDFIIQIAPEGITFQRHRYRPGHDHDDHETLQVGVDDSVPGVVKGMLQWLERHPYRGEGREHFTVPFGAAVEAEGEEKFRLPTTEFFYERAMERSAEIKAQVDAGMEAGDARENQEGE